MIIVYLGEKRFTDIESSLSFSFTHTHTYLDLNTYCYNKNYLPRKRVLNIGRNPLSEILYYI